MGGAGMNNEEKILNLLEQMQGRFDRIEEGQASMQADISGLKEGQTSLQEGQASMQVDISGLKEGQASMQADISGLKGDVSSLKESQASMRADISGLKEGQADLKEEVVVTKRRVLNIEKNVEKLLGIVTKAEYEQGKQLKAIVDTQVGYEQAHKQHEPRIIKLETEVDRLDSEVRSIRAAK